MPRLSEDEKIKRFAKDEMRRLVRTYQVVPQDDTIEEAHWWATIVLAMEVT